MNQRYQDRKIAGLCPRCGAPSSETSVLCEPHRLDANERFRRYAEETRGARRKNHQCAICGEPSRGFRCFACAMDLKAWRAGEAPERVVSTPEASTRAA